MTNDSKGVSERMVDARSGPLVSICIPVYNCEEHVGKAVESVLSQTYQNLELLICDDCSKDGTLGAIEKYQDPRIRIVRNEVNLGAVPNYNKVVSLVRGKYVKLLCADDYLYPDCVKKQVEILEYPANSDVLMAFCRRDVVGPDDKKILTRGYSGKSGRIGGIDLLRQSIRSGTNIIGEPGSVLLRTETLRRVGDFSNDIPWMVDLDYWSRILILGDAYASHEPLYAFRVSRGSWSVNAVRSHADDFCDFVTRLRSDPRFGITRWDSAVGRVMAKLNRRMRWVFYRFLLR